MQKRNFVLSAAMVMAALAQVGHAQQGVAWQSDIATAQQMASQTNRLVLVHFWAPSCGPCMRLEQEVFSRPETAQSLNTNFVCVKVNTDISAEVARTYNVTLLPTDVVLSADGRLIAQLRCPPTANQYLQQVNQVAEGYRQLTGRVATDANRAGDQVRQLDGRIQNPIPGLPSSNSPLAAMTPSPPAGTGNSAAAMTTPTGPSAAVAPPSQGVSTTQGAPVSAYSDDRYTDYLRNRPGETNAGPPETATAVGAQGHVNPDPRYAAPSAMQGPVLTQPQLPATASNYPPQVPVIAEQRSKPVAASAPPAIQLPPGSPPLALDGYCTVQLKEHKRWVAGDRRWGAVHRGRTYLFTSPDEQKKFLEAPDAFAPVISGHDPVLAMDNGQAVPGKREHGVFYENRVYLFADEASLQRFYQNPGRYAAEVVQAMR